MNDSSSPTCILVVAMENKLLLHEEKASNEPHDEPVKTGLFSIRQAAEAAGGGLGRPVGSKSGTGSARLLSDTF